MIIDSTFKDYYDLMAKHGVDTTVIYRRTPSSDIINSFRFHGRNIKELEVVIVGFCGKLYAVYCIQGQYHHTAASVKDALEKYPASMPSYYMSGGLNIYKQVEEVFKTEQYANSLKSLFLKYKTPIFVYHPMLFRKEPNIFINACLKPYMFMKAVPPAMAFIQIQSYISGVLGASQEQMVSISDKDMAASKGHDGKYSFKKPKGNGKWR